MTTKEELLKTQIIDAGYDPQSFVEYMNELREGGGDDIDIWTLDELNEAIKNYVQKQGAPKQEFDIIMPDDQITHLPTIQTTMDDEDDEYFTKSISVGIMQSNSLEKANNVNIISFEKKPGSLFTSPYVVYHIVVEPLNTEVGRRFNDFFWLRETLEKLFPGVLIPPIPKKTQSRSMLDIFVNKRMSVLNRFLKDCLSSPVISKCLYFEQFLCQKDEKKFQKIQNESSKIQKFSKLEQLANSTGSVVLSIGPINDQMKACNDFLNQKETFYKQLGLKSKQLVAEHEQITQTLYQIGEIFNQLYCSSTQLNNKLKQPIPQLQEIYITANNLMIQWGNTINQQMKSVQQNIQYFFKYFRKQTSALKQLMKNRDIAQQEYEKYKLKLSFRKEKLFQLQDTTKWELNNSNNQLNLEEIVKDKNKAFKQMLWKDTQMQKDLRDIFGYFNYTVFEEIYQTVKQGVNQYKQHFIDLAKIQTFYLSDQHMFWADMQSHLEIMVLK